MRLPTYSALYQVRPLILRVVEGGSHRCREMYAVEVMELVKKYGSHLAVDKASFKIIEGEIFGLIGPNGAGKSTTLRIIATLLKPTSGSVKVFNYDVVKDAKKIRSIISYLPEEAGAYKYLTGYEYLEMMAKIYSRDDYMEYVDRGIELSGLGSRIYSRIGEYSKGMLRRLLLARALMTLPKLAILDEPTSGMDVVYATEIRRMIKRINSEGVTILLSSHNMLEVEYLCEEIAIISSGRIIAQGSPDKLKDEYGGENLEDVFTSLVKSR